MPGRAVLVTAVYAVTLGLVTTALCAVGIEPEAAFASPVRAQLLGFALLILPVVLYFALVWLLVAMYPLTPLANRAWQTPYDRAAVSFVTAAR